MSNFHVQPRWPSHSRTNGESEMGVNSRTKSISAQVCSFFPRVRTPCGHSAQIIVEGREEQSDGGERNRETQHHTNKQKQHNPGPTGRVSTIM